MATRLRVGNNTEIIGVIGYLPEQMLAHKYPCMKFTVISFYTNDWLYPEHAAHLRADCERLGLAHRIEIRPSTNRYVGNCQIKPFFVRECLQDLSAPVFWMDVDGSILREPTLLAEDLNQDHDFVANQPAQQPHRIHVGSMLLNYTDTMREFVDAWCETIIRRRPLDDAAFNVVWDDRRHTLRTRLLPSQYFFIHKNPHAAIPPDTVILHRLSRSELKQRYKAGER
jgi:hypothetical protein